MKKKAILIINNPIDCEHCDLNVPFSKYHLACQETGFANGGDGSVPSWCPLKRPLKYVGNDYYIYDTDYLFKNLEREFGMAKDAREFAERIKAEKNESKV